MRSFLKKILDWSLKKSEVNYLYSTLLLLFISGLSLIHFIRSENTLFGLPLFFFLYTVGQAMLEVWGFILVAYILGRWAPRWVYFAFVSLSFIFLLLHFTQFALIRLMDTSLAYFFKYLFGCGIDHFFVAISALNLNATMLGMVFFSLLFIPFAGIFLFQLTQKISHRKPWKLSLSQIGIALGSIASILFLLDLIAIPYLSRQTHSKMEKLLPLGATFLAPLPISFDLPAPLSLPLTEQEVKERLPTLAAKTKPNIYLFVIETLRKDFVTEEIAPHMTAFGNAHMSFPASFSNATSTHLSWYAIFHAGFPYKLTEVRKSWKEGSVPLQMLKSLGYKIRVYSSADFRFYNMDKVLFGESRALADTLHEYADEPLAPFERDALCLADFEQAIEDPSMQEGNCFLFFYDATHSEYSFPTNAPPRFQPIATEVDYLTISEKEIEPLKNRYRNAIHYIDSLMGKFFTLLQDKNLYEEALILMTGDHGEEFFEEGALFHGTHLNHVQTSVPIFLKMGNRAPLSETASHIDLFPTLLHSLTGTSDFGPVLDGESLFTERKWPYRISVLQNAAETPSEFCIHQGDETLHLRFLSSKNIFSQTTLEVLPSSNLSPSTAASGGAFAPLTGSRPP